MSYEIPTIHKGYNSFYNNDSVRFNRAYFAYRSWGGIFYRLVCKEA